MQDGELLGPCASGAGGYSLIEALIAAGLMSLVMLALSGVFVQLTGASRDGSLQSTRTALATSLRQAIADNNVLKGSLKQPENAAFYGCVCGNATQSCASGKILPFSLYAFGDVTPQPNFKYYDANGSPCDGTKPSCTIQVETRFVAQCMPVLPSTDPSPPATCSTAAEFVGIFATIRLNPAAAATVIAFKAVDLASYTVSADLAGFCP